jgi:hypothetical protein
MDVMNTNKEKNKGEENNPDEKKKQISPDQKDEKDTTLAKRSGQRPALLFKRKKLTPQRGEEKKR